MARVLLLLTIVVALIACAQVCEMGGGDGDDDDDDEMPILGIGSECNSASYPRSLCASH
jgi:hypothetical protein